MGLGCCRELCLDLWVLIFKWGSGFVSVVWLWRAMVLVVALMGLVIGGILRLGFLVGGGFMNCESGLDMEVSGELRVGLGRQ